MWWRINDFFIKILTLSTNSPKKGTKDLNLYGLEKILVGYAPGQIKNTYVYYHFKKIKNGQFSMQQQKKTRSSIVAKLNIM